MSTYKIFRVQIHNFSILTFLKNLGKKTWNISGVRIISLTSCAAKKKIEVVVSRCLFSNNAKEYWVLFFSSYQLVNNF